ncbi:hypothetical protein [Burkholderia stabilis]|uniref:hypothetical protein n=1 Tax=Burkholderia stabilis TaxID=95485 RepID=UPI00080B0583|nr:hypothetical protein [Burkholderia stabilis]GAU04835.1 hypothetical protein BSLA_02r2744 [Burkholderia stabilis]
MRNRHERGTAIFDTGRRARRDIRRELRNRPRGRVGRADEVGEAIVFLLGNGFMNAEILHIDGGGRLV